MTGGVIHNPILRGFNPDPSILRVGDDYYIATSTFEWYPGVQIHHSRDLATWTLITRPLDRASQVDMRGNPDSCGVWAPCLTRADDLFWLIYTDVKRFDGNYKDTPNYLVTAPAIEGPWSDPVPLNASGFDPSLFHDDDGRKWLVNMAWDHRPDINPFAGILLQEYDPRGEKLVGQATNIFRGSDLGVTEGPHLYKRDGWYYLLTAEGGTGYNHAVTMARSRAIDGPYDLHPDKHILTAKDHPDAPLQRVGHGDFVETPDGSVYAVSLTSRPLPGTRRSPMGRETCIERMVWGDDGWLHPASGSPAPRLTVPGPDGAVGEPAGKARSVYDFAGPELPLDFQWLRTPRRERLLSLTDRPGYLRLYGREAIGSWFEQALVARRVTEFAYTASTTLEFEPTLPQHCAGLTVYYNRSRFHYLYVTHDEALGRVLQIQCCLGDWQEQNLTFPLDAPVAAGDGPVELAVRVDGAALQFAWAPAGEPLRDIGPVLDASICSDEAGRGEHASFTGTFVGMACQDLTGRGLPADFRGFCYELPA